MNIKKVTDVANMEKRRIFNPGKKVVLSPEDVP
jgi:hypothetical protein